MLEGAAGVWSWFSPSLSFGWSGTKLPTLVEQGIFVV